MKREEALTQYKQRALKYCNCDDFKNAWATMIIEMNKYKDLRNYPALHMGVLMMLNGGLNIVGKIRKYIEGFN